MTPETALWLTVGSGLVAVTCIALALVRWVDDKAAARALRKAMTPDRWAL